MFTLWRSTRKGKVSPQLQQNLGILIITSVIIHFQIYIKHEKGEGVTSVATKPGYLNCNQCDSTFSNVYKRKGRERCHLSSNKTLLQCILTVTSVIIHFQRKENFQRKEKVSPQLQQNLGAVWRLWRQPFRLLCVREGEAAKKQPRCRRERNDTFDVSRIQHQRP